MRESSSGKQSAFYIAIFIYFLKKIIYVIFSFIEIILAYKHA